ncbi:MAG: hypothetical protein BZY88_12720 [SAR202 cluster bacterium Io17-Chloro-G9]|nr:MAG: hypothetical protein BZY88_12720 [SAR202 cluster bacterium Io17-Chloro-G9]
MVNPIPTTPAALDGLRVLELAGMVAGPFCGKLLAALGADVLKIEPPKTGDFARRRGPFPGDVPHIERSGTFLYLNTGKRSLTLNVDDPQGRVVLGELVSEHDVLIHDIQPRRAAELGLGQGTLSQINQDLIVAAITPYGSSGPQANHTAYDINVFHAAGEGNLLPNGFALDQFPDRAPITAGSMMGSYQGGITAAVGIAAAVFSKMNGQIGQFVDCSIQEAQLAIGYLPIQRLEAEGFVETRFSRFFRVGGVMPAEDGYVELLTLEPRQWESLGEFLGSPEWAAPEKFQDPATHGAGINGHVRDWTAGRPKNWLYHQGQTKGVPFAPYYTPKEVFESPHQRDRGYFVNVDHREAGTYEYAGLPFRMGEAPASLERAPLLGEHNNQVLQSLGYTPEDIVMLTRSGVI